MFSLISGLAAPINRVVFAGQIPSKAMPKPPPTKPSSLADLRLEIDRIDEAMHALLIERGEIIDRLIAVKKTAGIRLRIPPGARGRHDAPAGRAPSRHPAARHRRKHLAGDHLDLHLCAGAVFRACRPVRRRRADARFRALPFRLHGAVRAAYGRGERRRGGHRVEGRSRPRPRLRRSPAPALGGPRSNSTTPRRSSRGCRSSNAPIIRRPCRCSWSRASPRTPW